MSERSSTVRNTTAALAATFMLIAAPHAVAAGAEPDRNVAPPATGGDASGTPVAPAFIQNAAAAALRSSPATGLPSGNVEFCAGPGHE